MKKLRKEMIKKAMAVNTVLTEEYLANKSNEFILANMHPDDRPDYSKVIKKLTNEAIEKSPDFLEVLKETYPNIKTFYMGAIQVCLEDTDTIEDACFAYSQYLEQYKDILSEDITYQPTAEDIRRFIYGVKN